jgi:hypothetical protein
LALIAVDEIIEALESFGYSQTMFDDFETGNITTTDKKSPTEYFYKVKEEIQKL